MKRKEKTKEEQVTDLIAEVVSLIWGYTTVSTFEELLDLNSEVDRRTARISILMIDVLGLDDEEDKDAQQEPERQPEIRQSLEADQGQIREGASDV